MKTAQFDQQIRANLIKKWLSNAVISVLQANFRRQDEDRTKKDVSCNPAFRFFQLVFR